MSEMSVRNSYAHRFRIVLVHMQNGSLHVHWSLYNTSKFTREGEFINPVKSLGISPLERFFAEIFFISQLF